MPAFDAQRTVAAAIGSALAQTVTDLEVLVVDDGSRDGTVAEVRRAAAADARVRLLEQANAGPSAARNRALEVAAAPVVAFLDADDLMLPDYAERMLGAVAGTARGRPARLRRLRLRRPPRPDSAPDGARRDRSAGSAGAGS